MPTYLSVYNQCMQGDIVLICEPAKCMAECGQYKPGQQDPTHLCSLLFIQGGWGGTYLWLMAHGCSWDLSEEVEIWYILRINCPVRMLFRVFCKYSYPATATIVPKLLYHGCPMTMTKEEGIQNPKHKQNTTKKRH